ncbi:hypothetical protein T05_2056 [Trichinella murrelli]|uniref:Uncharacterized protein n=1 Tax=Trichinella murrelli TaxID=144512 RepID=A0A0V0SQ71_9BILA|nr:hypothetical protein T05_2056 [Trichinella murrelli]
MEKKEEKWSKARASERMVSINTLEKMRFAEVERERLFFITKTQ